MEEAYAKAPCQVDDATSAEVHVVFAVAEDLSTSVVASRWSGAFEAQLCSPELCEHLDDLEKPPGLYDCAGTVYRLPDTSGLYGYALVVTGIITIWSGVRIVWRKH